MQTHAELIQRFGNAAGIVLDQVGELSRITLRKDEAALELFPQGAHLTKAVTSGGTSLLFVSGQSLFRPGKAIRGGVPLIFPWFGPDRAETGNPQHGFVRASLWTVDDLGISASKGLYAVLSFRDDDSTRAYRDFAFEASYRIELDHELRLSLSIRNGSDGPFEFEEALHTYLPVSDIHKVRIEGLSGAEFIDKTDSLKRKSAPAGDLVIEKETDSVFEGSESTVRVHDSGAGHALIVEKNNSRSTIVWNPWMEKGLGLADLGESWEQMVCVESANVGADSITLAPGQTHELRSTIRAEKL